MKNTFNDETDEYFSIIKSIIGKDLIDTNKYFGELQIIVSFLLFSPRSTSNSFFHTLINSAEYIS